MYTRGYLYCSSLSVAIYLLCSMCLSSDILLVLHIHHDIYCDTKAVLCLWEFSRETCHDENMHSGVTFSPSLNPLLSIYEVLSHRGLFGIFLVDIFFVVFLEKHLAGQWT